jgi:hypothetical protein
MPVLRKASRLGVMPCGMPGKLARLPKPGDIDEVYLCSGGYVIPLTQAIAGISKGWGISNPPA